MTEREEGTLPTEAVGPAIADEEVFAVLLVDDLMVRAPCAWIAARGVGTALVERGVPGEGQFSGGVDVAEEDAGDGFAGFRTDEPGLEHGWHLREPWEGGRVAGDVHIDQTGIDLEDGLDDLVLGVGQVVRLTVVTLAVLMVALVEATDEDDDIGLLRLGDGFGCELGLRAGLVE